MIVNKPSVNVLTNGKSWLISFFEFIDATNEMSDETILSKKFILKKLGGNTP